MTCTGFIGRKNDYRFIREKLLHNIDLYEYCNINRIFFVYMSFLGELMLQRASEPLRHKSINMSLFN